MSVKVNVLLYFHSWSQLFFSILSNSQWIHLVSKHVSSVRGGTFTVLFVFYLGKKNFKYLIMVLVFKAYFLFVLSSYLT